MNQHQQLREESPYKEMYFNLLKQVASMKAFEPMPPIYITAEQSSSFAALAALVQPSGKREDLITSLNAIADAVHKGEGGLLESGDVSDIQKAAAMLAADAQREQKLKKCKSPYCECESGKCTHPGFYDARQEQQAQSDSCCIDSFSSRVCAKGTLSCTANHEHPAQAGEPSGCVICGSSRPFSGTCGSLDTRALCNQTSNPEQQAQAGEQVALPKITKISENIFAVSVGDCLAYGDARVSETIAKKDAALKACVDALEELQGIVHMYHKNGPDWTHKDGTEVFEVSVLLDRQETIDAAITQGQGALK